MTEIPQTPPILPLSGEVPPSPSLTREGRGGFASGIRTAFVSTNSITQGEQVGILWGELLYKYHIKIHFAHRTFKWSNEARGKAAVHCVIIGFAPFDVIDKRIWDYENPDSDAHELKVRNINPYLVDAADVLITNRNTPISAAPEMNYGSFALDDGNYTLSETDREQILTENPDAEKFIKPFIGGQELLHNIKRWCLWLADAQPNELRSLPAVLRRVEAVRKWREESNRETTKNLSLTPTRFAEIRQPSTDYVAIPTLSSERRTYIPMAFLPAEVIASNQLYILPDATLFHFGILTSAMHMAWVRYTCGRLESRYRYSAGIVYNNFPWPDLPSPAGGGRAGDEGLSTAAASSGDPHPKSLSRLRAKDLIEAAAQAVLDARAQFMFPSPASGRGTKGEGVRVNAANSASLADLYDPLTMPPALVKAHQALDRAVDACYRKAAFTNDAQRVEFLFERYQQLTSLLPPATEKKKRSR